MSTWIIGDTHFFHEEIIRYESRPFISVDEMNHALVENWNSRVRDQDTVIILGDYSVGTLEQTENITRKLRGKKTLIIGNHDEFSTEEYMRIGFAEVYKHPIIYNEFIIMSHKPMYVSSNMPYGNIYAHVHGNEIYRDFTNKTFCASVERKALNYSPINLEDAIEKMLSYKENENG